jgi:hypothetical protein
VNNWRKFRRLPAAEKALFLEAIALLPMVRLGLKALGFRRLQALLHNLVASALARDPGENGYLSRRAARLVAVAASYAGGTCLAQSLVLAHLLARRGIHTDLRIGVRKEEEGFEAHAWVEAGGVVLNDGQHVTERFAAFDRNFALDRVSRQ